MATIYQQNWAPGNSTFTGVDVYRAPGYAVSPDSADPLYPSVKAAEGALIVVAGGPSGQNVLDWDGAHGDYQTTAVGINEFGPLANGTWNAQRFRVRFLQKWSSVALAESGFTYPLFQTQGETSTNLQAFLWVQTYFTIAVRRSIIDGLYRFFSEWAEANGTEGDWDAQTDTSDPFDVSPYSDTWVETEIGVSCGVGATPNLAAANGSFYLKLNGTVVYQISGIRLIISDADTTVMRSRSIAFGYAGLIGPLTDIVLDTPSVPVAVATPLAPQAPCEPQSEVGNGGKGASGCNNGGVGFVSQYTGPYGTVPDHDDPVDGETLTGKEGQGVEIWADVVHTEYPATSPAETTHRRAMVELADDPSYEGGYKEAGLLAVGDIENALGNEQGAPEAHTVDVEFSDTIDRRFRRLLEDQELEGDEIRIKLASDPGRASSVPARVISRSIIQRPRLSSRLKASVSAVDKLYSDPGPLGPSAMYPFWTFGDVGDGMPNAPADTKALPIVPWYGEKSDEGATDPLTGEPRAKGLVPGVYCGRFTGITGNTEQLAPAWAESLELDTSIQSPAAFAYNLAGGSITGFVGSYVIAVKDGKGSPISNLAGTGPHTNPDTGRSLTIFFDGAGPGTADEYRVFLFEGFFDPYNIPASNGRVRVKTHDATTFDGQWVNGETKADFRTDFESWEDGDDALEFVTVPDPDSWGFLAFSLGPIFRYYNIYGSDLGGGDEEMTHDRVLLDVLGRGDILVPGINLDAKYSVFLNSETGREFWISGIYIKDGPLLDDHINGRVTITANGFGLTEDADGEGLPLYKAYDCYQHWWENHVIGPDRMPWSSGPYADETTYPRFEDGTAMVRTSSFRERQAFTATRYGGIGLTVGWYARGRRPTTEVDGSWMRQLDVRRGNNGHGQVMVWGLDETRSTASWRRVDEVSEVFGAITRVSGEERANVVSGAGDWDPDKDKFRIAPITYANEAAIAKFKNRRKPGEPIEFDILNDENQMRWVLQRTLARLAYGTTLVEATGPIGWLDQDVGDGILFTSEDGTGPDGYVDHPFVILRRRFSVRTRLVLYTLWDVKNVILETAYENGLERLFYITDDTDLAPSITDDPDLAPLVLP